MFEQEYYYSASCDRCGKMLESAEEGLMLFESQAEAEEILESEEWAKHNGRWYCPDCKADWDKPMPSAVKEEEEACHPKVNLTPFSAEKYEQCIAEGVIPDVRTRKDLLHVEVITTRGKSVHDGVSYPVLVYVYRDKDEVYEETYLADGRIVHYDMNRHTLDLMFMNLEDHEADHPED